MKCAVIGCGRWGSFIAWYLDRLGKKTMLYGRASSLHMQRLLQSHSNDYLSLPESVKLTTDLQEALKVDLLFVSVGAQGFRSLCRQLRGKGLREKTIVLCMKGLEIGTGERLSRIAEEELDASNRIAVWLGPGHVQDFTRGIPNCMVIDSREEALKRRLVEELSGGLIRFYIGSDLIGNEVGAAAKNVVGIAAGMLDGLELGSLKGALMARGTHEISLLIRALGGEAMAAYGLCHLGDYEATVFSPYSHNRQFGEAYVRKMPYHELAEGYYTVKALMQLGESSGVELPICCAVYDVLYRERDVHEVLDGLFRRSTKSEF